MRSGRESEYQAHTALHQFAFRSDDRDILFIVVRIDERGLGDDEMRKGSAYRAHVALPLWPVTILRVFVGIVLGNNR